MSVKYHLSALGMPECVLGIRKGAEKRGQESCSPREAPDRHGPCVCPAPPAELSTAGQGCRVEGQAWDDIGARGSRVLERDPLG